MLKESYFISHVLKREHKDQLLALFKKQFWLKNSTLEDIENMERTCLIFALIEKSSDDLVGFMRVLADDVKYAYIHDVIVEEKQQGKGLGKFLIESALNHPQLEKIVCFELLCLPEKIPFYNKFKFNEHHFMKALRFDKRKLEKSSSL